MNKLTSRKTASEPFLSEPSSGVVSACDKSLGYRPPQFDIKFLMQVTAMGAVWIALWPITSIGSKVIIAVIMLTFLFGCERTRRSVMWVTPGLYCPTFLLLWIVRAEPEQSMADIWGSYGWQLTGVLFDAGIHQFGEFWFNILTTLGALVLFFALVMMGRVSPSRSHASCVVAAIYSSLNTFISIAILL